MLVVSWIYTKVLLELPDNIKKGTYKDRKYRSIEYTKYFLRNDKDNRDFLINTKKDDLADSYLQCLTYYKKNYKNA